MLHYSQIDVDLQKLLCEHFRNVGLTLFTAYVVLKIIQGQFRVSFL